MLATVSTESKVPGIPRVPVETELDSTRPSPQRLR